MCKGTRINEISQNAKENIENNLLYNMENYAYLNFELPK
jgi:tRNA G26 N,N-dimethylase Trm1